MRYAKIDNDNNVVNVYDVNNISNTLLLCPSNTIEGWVYNPADQSFTQRKPFTSWILQSDRTWDSPTPYPADGKAYCWIEETKKWKEIGLFNSEE